MKKKLLVLLMVFVTMSMGVWAQTRNITGTVTSAEDGSSLPGVTVRVKNAPGGVTTNQNGQYQISVSSQAQTLVFSFIGMKQTEVAIGNRTTINVALESETTELGEVVVTALGIKREQKALGYAISKVDSKELTKVASTNFGSALYGKAAGVRITSAPGGPTSAVDIKIRGMNSINFSSQPLIIVDGVPIRNGEANNSGYWGDQRIRGNGLVDINPEDIADLSILKGASASALYGSEAANGVVVITTKKGTRRDGIGVDASYSYTVQTPAFNPALQEKYGPGYYDAINLGSYGTDKDGWLYAENPTYYDPDTDTYGNVYDGTLPYAPWRAYGQWGPEYDGRDVIHWTGRIVPYEAQPNNWNDLYAIGANSMANVAVNKAGDWGNMRISYTRLDYTGTTRGNEHDRNTFDLNSTLNLGKRLQVDLVAKYVTQHTLNRPYKINRITNNYGGFFSRMDDIDWYVDKSMTSKGYRFRTGSQASATPDENITMSFRASALLDYFWRTLANQEDEWQDRLMTSATARLTLAEGLTLRGRVGSDYTAVTKESRNKTTVPLSIGNSGGFSMGMQNYNTSYGDALLSYDADLTDEIGLLVNAGWQGRRETYKAVNAGTVGGLSAENWFHQNASNNNDKKNGGSSYNELLKYAFLGTASLSFRDFAFLEFTGRQESSSTLPPGSNTFFYPSVNASFLFSDALGLEGDMDYGKLRVAWGIVGNAPPMYAANNAYSQGAINGIIYNSVSSSYGNDGIRPEEKHEFEVGTEMKFFGNRLGLEATVYNNKIVDQILWLDVPTTIGASRMLTNIGELKNLGFEASLYGSPLATDNLRWDLRGNFSLNKNEVVALMPGVDMLTHASYDVGAAKIVSVPGGAMGDIITYLPKQLNGRDVIDPENGYYQINFEEFDENDEPVDYGYGDTRQKVGNAMPKLVGGFGSYIDLKGFFIDFAIDYSWGGDIVSLAGQYMKGAGMWEETLEYRDAENGGLSYYYDNDDPLSGNRVLAETAPAGQKMYDDGVIIDGVFPDGTENDIVLQASEYYMNTYQWGVVPAWGSGMCRYDDAVHKNHYIKFREASIGYNVPKSIASKLKCNNIRVSLVGSNLFYVYRTFKQFDPETNIGTNWVNSASVQGSTSASRSIGFSVRASF